jgi:hypothetical protein
MSRGSHAFALTVRQIGFMEGQAGSAFAIREPHLKSHGATDRTVA